MAGSTIDLRALLGEYREAAAALAAAEADGDARQARWERERTIRRAEGREPDPEAGDEIDRLWESIGERYGAPERDARAKLGAAVRIAFGLDPWAKFDRPRAVLVDGCIVVTHDRDDDPHLRPCLVVEAGDVLTLTPADKG